MQTVGMKFADPDSEGAVRLERGISAGTATVGSGAPLILVIVIISIMLPQEASFFVGDTRLTLGRVVLLLAFPVVIGRYLAVLFQRPGTNIGDVAVLLVAAWYFIAPANNAMGENNPRWWFSSGAAALEISVLYLLARVFVLTSVQALAVLRLLCLVTAIVGFIGIFDVLSNEWITRRIFAELTGNNVPITKDNERLGIFRATSTMEHPILFGTMCALAAVLALNIPHALETIYFGWMSDWRDHECFNRRHHGSRTRDRHDNLWAPAFHGRRPLDLIADSDWCGVPGPSDSSPKSHVLYFCKHDP